MVRSNLIQRLRTPYRNSFLGRLKHSVSFGVWGSGLTEDDRDKMIPIADFDWMCAVEFDGGAISDVLDTMTRRELVSYQMPVRTSPYDYNPGVRPIHGRFEATVYVICPVGIQEETAKRIQKFGFEEPFGVKRRVYLEKSIRQLATAQKPRNVGWIEMDNNFMFFLSRQMHRHVVDFLTHRSAIVTIRARPFKVNNSWTY